MRVGLDGKHQPGIPTLEYVRRRGYDGASFRSPENFTATLDEGVLREARAYADANGLYFELGVGRVNPYTFGKNPELAAWGDGDYRTGFQRAVRACLAAGCRELWCVTGTYVDRFRGAAPWPEQLRATEAFLRSLAPFLRDVGCRLNLETHEEVTVPELLRLVEGGGPDVLGLCLDPANILARAADPAIAGKRVAPYVHMMQAKDAVVYFVPDGLQRQVRPCGDGAALHGADLAGANLSRANLTGVVVEGIDLAGANLTRAVLVDASLLDAKLAGALLRGATLRNTDLRGADLRAAVLTGATLDGADVTGADLTGAAFAGAQTALCTGCPRG